MAGQAPWLLTAELMVLGPSGERGQRWWLLSFVEQSGHRFFGSAWSAPRAIGEIS
jgi:hypothetical protein